MDEYSRYIIGQYLENDPRFRYLPILIFAVAVLKLVYEQGLSPENACNRVIYNLYHIEPKKLPIPISQPQ